MSRLTTGKVLIAIVVAIILVSLAGAYFLSKAHEGITIGESVAVISLSGEIGFSSSSIFGTEGASVDNIVEKLRKAEKDSSVKAIVLEINSPGGSFVASEEIANEIKRIRKNKPVVAWLGEIATSGAYYVASASNYIVADKATLTGSIGVIFVFPKYEELLNKLGVEMRVIKAGKYKDIGSPYRNMTAEEREIVQKWADQAYEEFLRDIAENRNMSIVKVREIAEGKIYTGREAVEIGLADSIGTRRDAIKKAAELGNISGEPEIVRYERRGIFGELIKTSAANFGYGFGKAIAEVMLNQE